MTGAPVNSCHAAPVASDDLPRSTVRSHFCPVHGPRRGESSGWSNKVFKGILVQEATGNSAEVRISLILLRLLRPKVVRRTIEYRRSKPVCSMPRMDA